MSRARTANILLTGLAFAVVYFLLRSVGQTPDGLSYALAVRDGIDLYHPHHLLYVPVTRFLFLLTGGHDAILAGVLHNLIWLVVLAFGAWRLAGQLRWTPGAAMLAAVALLASRGVLFYATHVETYLPALACLVMFVAVWFRPQHRNLVAAVWLALAVLYHQTNVLLVVPLLVTSEHRRQDFLRVVLPAGVAVMGLYFVGWRLVGSGVELFSWLFTYAQADVPAWGNAGHFSGLGLLTMGASQLRMVLPVPTSYQFVGGGFMLAGLVWLVGWHLRRRDHQRERRFALVYLAVYLPFFLWWIPSDADFFLATLLPLWWLLLLLIADLGERRQGRWLAVPVALLLVGNLWFTARPFHADAGPSHAQAMALHQATDRQTPLVVGYGVQQELLDYTDRQDVFEGDELALGYAGGGQADPIEGGVAVGQQYLQLMLARSSTGDHNLLRALLNYDEVAGTQRTTIPLPDDCGLLINDEVQPAMAWDTLLATLGHNGSDR